MASNFAVVMMVGNRLHFVELPGFVTRSAVDYVGLFVRLFCVLANRFLKGIGWNGK